MSKKAQKEFILPSAEWAYILSALVQAGQIAGSLYNIDPGTYAFRCSDIPDFMKSWMPVEKGSVLAPFTNEEVLSRWPRQLDHPPRNGALVMINDLALAGDFIRSYLEWKSTAISLAPYEEGYLVQLNTPLVWFVKDWLAKSEKNRVFWSYGENTQLFYEDGLAPVESVNALPDGLFTLNSEGTCSYIGELTWIPVERFIQVVPPAKSKQPDPDLKIEVSLELKPTAREDVPDILHISDTGEILKAAGSYSWDMLDELEYISAPDGSLYLLKGDSNSLWSHLAGLFDGFSYLYKRPQSAYDIALPLKRRLVPQLGPVRLTELLNNWEVRKESLVLFTEVDDGTVHLTYFEQQPRPLTQFLPVLQSGLSRVKKEKDSLYSLLEEFIKENPPLVRVEDKAQTPGKFAGKSTDKSPDKVQPPKKKIKSDSSVKGPDSGQEEEEVIESVPDEVAGADRSTSELPEDFRKYLALEEAECSLNLSRIIAEASDSLENPAFWRELSAVMYALKRNEASRIAWAQYLLIQPISKWQNYSLHPEQYDNNEDTDFEKCYTAIENKQLAGELHYMEVVLASLKFDKPDSFMLEQKSLYQDYFSGKRHPMGRVFRESRTDQQYSAAWDQEKDVLWERITGAAGKSVSGILNFIKSSIFFSLGLEKVKPEPLNEADCPDSEIRSGLNCWAQGDSGSSDGHTAIFEVLHRIQASGKRLENPESFLFFLPDGIPFDQILKRYQGKIQDGITSREDFFKNERNDIQRIINNQIIYDICRSFGVLEEFRILIPQLTTIGKDVDPLVMTASLQAVKLQRMFGMHQGSISDEDLLTEILEQLPDPITTQNLQPWNYFLSLLWDFPEDRRNIFIENICRRLTLFPEPSDGKAVLYRLRIAAILLAVLVFSEVSADVLISQLELRRKSRWVQVARQFEKEGYQSVKKQFEEETK